MERLHEDGDMDYLSVVTCSLGMSAVLEDVDLLLLLRVSLCTTGNEGEVKL